jgi:hypothetical protein
MERAAHAIGLSAVTYGRYQSTATIASMLSNLGLAAVSVHLSRTLPLACALLVCGLSCAALTTVTDARAFALALLIFNASWFMCYFHEPSVCFFHTVRYLPLSVAGLPEGSLKLKLYLPLV